VRKRVIKVMRDICVQQPTFPKIPEMCALMIKRISDEEAIKDLVGKVFHELWFSHSKTSLSEAVLNTRVESILDAV
jgi:cohesin loading factor subunit SCC2